jgi:hypothetical protein
MQRGSFAAQIKESGAEEAGKNLRPLNAQKYYMQTRLFIFAGSCAGCTIY